MPRLFDMSVTGVKLESVDSRSTEIKVEEGRPCKSIVDLTESDLAERSYLQLCFLCNGSLISSALTYDGSTCH